MVDRLVAGSRSRRRVMMRLSLVAEVPVVTYLQQLFSMIFWILRLLKKRAMSNRLYFSAQRGGQWHCRRLLMVVFSLILRVGP